MEQSLYDVLGVPRDASPSQIKAAFRTRAKQSHPDTGGDTDEFQRLKMAYDVLSDAEHRRHYDETGETPADRISILAEDERFRTLLGDLLVTIISQAGAPEFTDILTETRETLSRQIKAVDRQLVTSAHLAARLGEVLRRLHGPEEGDVMKGLLRERLTETENKIKLTRALKRRLVKLQETLEHYRYDIEVESIM